MSKYRFKTKEEFQKISDWHVFDQFECPKNWSSIGTMNIYLGQDISDEYNFLIEQKKIFYIDSWAFQYKDIVLKTVDIKCPSFNKGDYIEVIKTNATDEEWVSIGKIDIPFREGDTFTVYSIFDVDKSVQLKPFGSWFPSSLFKLISPSTNKSYTIKDFRVGQKVKVVSLTASDKDWESLGKIKVHFTIGQILTISKFTCGICVKEDTSYAYPACIFEPCEEAIIDSKDCTIEKLISEAKSRYPKGTTFYPLHILTKAKHCIITNDHFEVLGDRVYAMTDDKKYCSTESRYGNNTTYNRIVYEKGKWAEVFLKSSFVSTSISNIGKYVLSITSNIEKI